MFLRCRHAAKVRFVKLRSDVLVKLQLLDNKRGEGGRERGREGEREREGGRKGGREGEREGEREGGREGEREPLSWSHINCIATVTQTNVLWPYMHVQVH